MQLTALLLDASPDAVVANTPEGEVLYWSQAAQTVFGYGRDEIIGRTLQETIVPPERFAEELKLTRDCPTSPCTYESFRRRKDGSLVYVDVTSKIVEDPHSGAHYILSSKKDVTQLKVLRDARMVEARFGGLLESTPDGIVIASPTGRILFANHQLETLFGYGRGELCGEFIEILLPERLRPSHVGHRSKFFAQPRTRSMGAGLQLHGRRKDGGEFPLEISLSPLQTDAGTLVMSAVRDISERKRVEQELQEKNIELQNANRAKDRFLAAISHELRTPLNAIIGFTGTLLMKLPGPLTQDQEQQLRTVQSSARHLLALINDLLDLARIEAGKLQLHVEPVACQQLLEEVAASLRPQAEKKGLVLAVTAPATQVVAMTDRRILSQIVLNLANNAIKFTEQGGVDLRLQPSSSDNKLHISVIDTGIGIRSEDQTKLFHAFSQVDTTTHRRHEGTGLGLHLSQKLASLLGGHITFQSEYGKGSTFILQFSGN